MEPLRDKLEQFDAEFPMEEMDEEDKNWVRNERVKIRNDHRMEVNRNKRLSGMVNRVNNENRAAERKKAAAAVKKSDKKKSDKKKSAKKKSAKKKSDKKTSTKKTSDRKKNAAAVKKALKKSGKALKKSKSPKKSPRKRPPVNETGSCGAPCMPMSKSASAVRRRKARLSR
jgi:hypothetical protein